MILIAGFKNSCVLSIAKGIHHWYAIFTNQFHQHELCTITSFSTEWQFKQTSKDHI